MEKKATKKATPKKKAAAKKGATSTTRKWSAKVTETSDALVLDDKVFQQRDPKKIAASLKKSADKSSKRKTTPFQSAMSMLNFFINRAGKNLTEKEKEPLEQAKDELRKLYGKETEVE